MAKMQKGSKLGVVKTLGEEKFHFDKYNLVGLSLGQLSCIKNALEKHATTLSVEILYVMEDIDNNQTMSQ